MKKKITVIICFALVAVMATGCTTFNNFKNAFFSEEPAESAPEEGVIRIGVYEPLSGEYRQYGEEERIGIELANEMYPEAAGKKVELIYADNQSDMYAAETAIQELVAQQPSVILGSYGDTVTLVAGDAVKANSIPAISITSTNPLITVNNPYYFCATFADTKQGDALAEFVFSIQEKTKAATVKVTADNAATATVKRFESTFKRISENNESIVGSYELDPVSTDYSAILDGIIESGAQAVFLDVSPATATEFLKQAKEANMSSLLYVGPSSWNTEDFIKFVQENKDLNVAYASDFTTEIEVSEMQKEFLKAYKEKYGEDAEPSESTAVAFDAYVMAITAIEDAYEDTMEKDVEEVADEYSTEAAVRGETEALEEAQETGLPSGEAIRDALSQLNSFEGVSGTISYEGTNEAVKNVIVKYITRGEIQEAYTI